MGDFNITQIIEKKKNGQELSDEDIEYFVQKVKKMSEVKSESISESPMDRSQLGALLMAICLKGIEYRETRKLTETMTNSGYVFSWPEEWRNLVVDKHSTGGVGDKVSLILTPILAALGLKVPMISGRSLCHTGGTLDKLESIPGFCVNLTKEEIYEAVETVGCCIVSQNEDCAPIDSILYQCREMTATVACQPLIVASIASKKLCEGVSALVYDVKYGKGSVFSSKDEAEDTAKDLVRFSSGVSSSALLTSMENPLGRTIGHYIEVTEVVECLRGNGPSDVMEVTRALALELLQSVYDVTEDDGLGMIAEAIESGKALDKFHDMIIYQGVHPKIAKELCSGDYCVFLKCADFFTDIFYNGEAGYITEINPLVLANKWKEELALTRANASQQDLRESTEKYLGSSKKMKTVIFKEDTTSLIAAWRRELIQSNKHPGIGFELFKVVGDRIKTGEAWVRMHHQRKVLPDEVIAQLQNAISVERFPKTRVLIDTRFFMSSKHSLVKQQY